MYTADVSKMCTRCIQRMYTIMNDLRNIDSDLPKLRDENLTNILLYGNQKYDDKTNQIILMHLIRQIKDLQRFDMTLFDPS